MRWQSRAHFFAISARVMRRIPVDAARERDADLIALDAALRAPADVDPRQSQIVGTLPYMAPEQLEGRDADARTDIWALGAILSELVTGVRAFQAATRASLTAAILEHEPAPISSTRPMTPSALERLIRKCLAKDPDARWQSARDVADELRWLREPRAEGAAAGEHVFPRLRRALRAVIMFAGALALGALGAGAMWRLRPHGHPPNIGHPRRLFDFDASELLSCAPARCFGVAPDGQHFYTMRTPKPPPPQAATHINIVPYWFEELKTKVPSAH